MVVSKTANSNENLLTDAFVRMIGTSDFDEDLVLRDNLEPNVFYKESIEKTIYKRTKFFSMRKENDFSPHYLPINMKI